MKGTWQGQKSLDWPASPKTDRKLMKRAKKCWKDLGSQARPRDFWPCQVPFILFLASLVKIIKTKYFIAFSVQKCELCHINDKKSLFLWILLEKLRISNFEMWSWDVIFVPFQKNSPVLTGI